MKFLKTCTDPIGWERRWRNRGKEAFSSGFSSAFNSPASKAPQPLKNFDNYDCLVLLGEAGSGKTCELEQYAERLAEIEKQFIYIPLRSVSSGEDFINKIQRKIDSNNIQTKSEVYFIFDSIDEGLLNFSATADNIYDAVEHCLPKYKIKLRLSCRTTVYPTNLTDSLKGLFGDGKVAELLLEPLTLQDSATDLKGGEEFIKNIIDMDLEELATHPVSLLMLRDIWAAEGEFPRTKTELYSRAIKERLKPSPQYIDAARSSGSRDNFDPGKRWVICQRAAVALTIGNFRGISSEIAKDEIDISADDLSGISGSEYGLLIDILEHTSLFNQFGTEKLFVPNHKSLIEFLAADFINQSSQQLKKKISLFITDIGGIAPQLYETAAWLASMSEEFQKRLMEEDPAVLLSSDIWSYEKTLKEKLFDRLLQAFDSNELNDSYKYRGLLGRLNIEGIADKLKDAYQKSKSQNSKIFIMDTAAECLDEKENRTSELGQFLLEAALSQEEFLPLRERAAIAICESGSHETIRKLETLVRDDHPTDQNDELRGYTLRALVENNLIKISEIFDEDLIPPPKNTHHIGDYASFLLITLPPEINKDNIVAAIDWATAIDFHIHISSSAYHKLIINIIMTAWDNIDDELVFNGFVKILKREVLSRSNQLCSRELFDETKFLQSFYSNHQKRLELYSALYDTVDEKTRNRICRLSCVINLRLISFDDLDYLFGKLNIAESEPEIDKWMEAINGVFNFGSEESVDKLINFYKPDRPYSEKLSKIYPFLKAEDKHAALKGMIEEREKEWELQIPTREFKPVAPEPEKSLKENLAKYGQDLDLAKFWYELMLDLSVKETDVNWRMVDVPDDLTITPGWKTLNDEEREEVKNIAWRFITEVELDSSDFFLSRSYSSYQIYLYRALYLLSATAPEKLSEISEERWKAVFPCLLMNPLNYTGPDAAPGYERIIKAAYEKAPDVIHSILDRYIRSADNYKKSIHHLGHKLEHIWNESIGNLILSCLQQASIDEITISTLFRLIMNRQYRPGIELANSILEGPLLKEFTMGVLRTYFDTDRLKEGWKSIIKIIRDEKRPDEFIAELVESFSLHSWHDENNTTGLADLDEEDLGILLKWLLDQEKYNLKQSFSGSYAVTGEIRAVELISVIRRYLVGRGTEKALTELLGLREQFSDKENINFDWDIEQLKNNVRRNTWLKLPPKELFEHLNSNLWAPTNNYGLMEAILELLEQYQKAIKGEDGFLTKASDIYSAPKEKKRRNEEDISQNVSRWIFENLKNIFVCVEYFLHPKIGELSGQRTDIQIESIQEKSKRNLSVIIECKGDWNRGSANKNYEDSWDRAMESQLRDRYLISNGRTHGIYLVYYFGESGKSYYDLKTQLEKQAGKLSVDGIKIVPFILDCNLGDK